MLEMKEDSQQLPPLKKNPLLFLIERETLGMENRGLRQKVRGSIGCILPRKGLIAKGNTLDRGRARQEEEGGEPIHFKEEFEHYPSPAKQSVKASSKKKQKTVKSKKKKKGKKTSTSNLPLREKTKKTFKKKKRSSKVPSIFD